MQTNSETPKPRKLTIQDVPPNGAAAAPAPKASAPKAADQSIAPPKFVASQLLELGLIEPDPHNPRKDFPKDAMNELINSVLLFGIRQPIEVRAVAGGKFRVVFGERRYRAAKAAGLKEIPAIVRVMTDIEASEVQLAENLRRADLSPLEIAGGYQRQLDLGRTMDQVCERSGKKRSAVYATLQLLQLGDAGRKALGEEKISTSVAQLVARVPKALQDKALGIVLGTTWQGPLTFRQAEQQLGQVFTIDLRKAPWELKSEATPCVAKSCAVCPKRAGNTPELFPDIKNPDTCTDPVSYQQKLHLEMKKTIEAKGYKLLTPKEAPPDDLFWNNGAGGLKQESGYVEPSEKCFEDTQNRIYGDLLTAEQKKKLIRVALDHHGKARQLLERAGLQREVRKGGIFKPRKKNALATSSTRSSNSRSAPSPARYRPQPPTIDDLVDKALVGKMVETVEKKGLTPAMVKIIAFELAGNAYALHERRGTKTEGYRYVGDTELEKKFGKLKPNEMAGLLFEAAFDQLFEGGSDISEITQKLGVDQKKVRDEVAKANPVRWSEDKHGATGIGVKGVEYLIEKKGSSFVFTKPKDAGELKFDSLEKAKATAVKVETGLAVWKPESAPVTAKKKMPTKAAKKAAKK